RIFWDIEIEKKNRIYLLFIVLLIIYFTPVYLAWSVIKMFYHLRTYEHTPRSDFYWFGIDTVIVLILAVGLTVLHWYLSNRNVVNRVIRLLSARIPDRADHYHIVFANIVDEIAAAAGGIQVEPYVIPTGALNAFAISDIQGRNVIGVTEGLLSRLQRAELQSVVAHEIAHIASNDCLLTTITCALFNIHSEALKQINASAQKREIRYNPLTGEDMPSSAAAVTLMTLPVLFFVFITDSLALLLNMFINREKEYRADAAAVRYSRDPLSLARALFKISTHWRGAGYSGENLAPIFILNPQYRRLEEQENIIATLFSTHPPVIRRLQILSNMGHTELEELFSLIGCSKGPKSENEIIYPEFKFFAEKAGKWAGPFTVMQLQSLDYLEPDTKLKPADADNTILAGELAALSYYFEKREEPARKIRWLCPDCRQWLIVYEYEGLQILYCPFCHGVLVSTAKLPRIIVRKEKGFTQAVQRYARLLIEQAKAKQPGFKILINTLHPRHCPRCGKLMIHRFYSYAYHIEIDECRSCQVIWFDQDELEILQCLIELGE
ncbi:hypothetical protein A2Y85_04430, partial [candidate division WOR-3 bacterium RBG_13_43_14]